MSDTPDITRTINEIVEIALRKARSDGWDKGKKQVETPLDYTLADETKLKEIHHEAVHKLVTLVNEARVDELKKFVNLEYGVNKPTLALISDRINALATERYGSMTMQTSNSKNGVLK